MHSCDLVRGINLYINSEHLEEPRNLAVKDFDCSHLFIFGELDHTLDQTD